MMTHLDQERPKQERVKCVVVGDSGCGKTRLICARARSAKFTLRELCTPHVPTVWAIDQYHQHQDVLENSWEAVDDVNVTLRLWDTFGCHDKDRKFAFGRSDVVALCFSVVNPASLRHCVDKWWPEIRRFCPKTPIMLIGCRNDMRHLYKDPQYTKIVRDERRRIKEADVLLPEKGRQIAAQIGAVGYYETSVLTGFGVRSVFTNAIRAALVHRRQTRFWASHLKNVRNAEFQSPYLIPAPPTPEQTVEASTMADDLSLMVREGQGADVELLAGDGHSVFAHGCLLAAASKELEGILTGEEAALGKHSCLNRCEVLSSDSRPASHAAVRTRLHLRPEFMGKCLQQLLHFLYTGALDMTPETVQPLQVLSQDLGLRNLTTMISNRLSGDEEENNIQLGQEFLLARDKRLAAFAMDQGALAIPLSDVVFVVDDGEVRACRALIGQRSSFMAAMLCGQFEESRRVRVPLPELDSVSLRHCLYYLYLDACPQPQDLYAAMDVLAVADRFCLPRLMQLLQEHIVTTYLALPLTPDDPDSRLECQLAQRTLELLEPAEAFHATYLYAWCFNFIATHYVFIYRHHLPQFRALTPNHMALLSKQRWPPVWYINEYDLYEQSLERRRHEMLDNLRKRRSRFSLGPRQHSHAPDPPMPVPPPFNNRARTVSEPPSLTRREIAARWKLLLCSR